MNNSGVGVAGLWPRGALMMGSVSSQATVKPYPKPRTSRTSAQLMGTVRGAQAGAQLQWQALNAELEHPSLSGFRSTRKKFRRNARSSGGSGDLSTLLKRKGSPSKIPEENRPCNREPTRRRDKDRRCQSFSQTRFRPCLDAKRFWISLL